MSRNGGRAAVTAGLIVPARMRRIDETLYAANARATVSNLRPDESATWPDKYRQY